MGDTDGAVGRVDTLASMTAGTHDVDADILVSDLDVGFLGLGEHGDASSRSMDASAAFGDGYALDPMDAAFPAKRPVDILAADRDDDFLVSSQVDLVLAHDFHLPVALLGIAAVHAEQVACEQRGLVAADAAANLHDDVPLVVRVFREQQNRELVIELLFLRHEVCELLLNEVAHLVVRLLGKHRLVLGNAARDILVHAEALDDGRELRVLLVHALPAVDVRHHRRVGNQRLELPEFVFDRLKLFEQE